MIPKAPFDWSKIDGFDALVELALNMHWSWNHAADELWEGLDKELWAATQNPWVILRTVSKEKIKAALSAPKFRQGLDFLLSHNRTSYSADAWFQNKHQNAALKSIAYFSMEFMLSEALPIYSGGLGNVAGDQLKAASDLGVLVVGVGLLYGYATQLAAEGRGSPDASGNFDENVLTMGFARRFATYKRPNLLLYDPERLVRFLTDPLHPVQLILAGKAHPQDLPGQTLIEQWKEFIQRPEVQGRVVFLNDYDMLLAQELVQGIDLWINTPRRPWEACGTSGMKVLVNGGLNLSELDGWWAEAYSPEVGWAIGDGKEHGDDPAWDAQEAEDLYALLEREVVPEFYERDETNMPTKWLGRIRESMARLTPEFSATRAIREYTENHYLPASSNYEQRAAEDSKQGLVVLHWRQELDRHWSALSFGAVQVETHEDQHFFHVEVSLGTLNPDQICVELYASSNDGCKSSIESMKTRQPGADSQGMITYSAQVSATRASSDYTARIIPYHTNVSVPLEAGQILWQR